MIINISIDFFCINCKEEDLKFIDNLYIILICQLFLIMSFQHPAAVGALKRVAQAGLPDTLIIKRRP